MPLMVTAVNPNDLRKDGNSVSMCVSARGDDTRECQSETEPLAAATSAVDGQLQPTE